MKKAVWARRGAALLLAGCLLLPTFSAAAEQGASQGVRDNAPAFSSNADSYFSYAQQWASKPSVTETVRLDASHLSAAQQATVGQAGGIEAVLTAEEGFAEFTFSLEKEGLFEIAVYYCPLEGKTTPIERKLTLDGAIPFAEAGNIVFSRIWKDGVEYNNGFAFDAAGHELRPKQQETYEWTETVLRDAGGQYNEPLRFYLAAGTHTLRLDSIREPMAIGRIELRAPQALPAYAQVKQQYQQNGYKAAASNQLVLRQGENSYRKSHPTLYPIFDRTSGITQPFDVDAILLNTIGAANWQTCGEWISWQITVPESGLYKLALRYRNNLVNGQAVARRLYIDGAVPFAEANAISFPYDSDWQVACLSDGDTEFEFYFEAGKTYEIKLEACLGQFADILRAVDESCAALNDVYRQIMRMIGTNPDPNADHDVDLLLPDCMVTLQRELDRLRGVIWQIEQLVGDGGNYISTLNATCLRLEDMLAYPEEIPAKFSDFKNRIVALGSWIMSAEKQPLEIDFIVAAPSQAQLPEADEGFFASLWTQLRLFIASFYNDYNSFGAGGVYQRSVDVWLASGRQQATILKSLAANTFEPQSGICANVRLVAAGALLPAFLSGNGPDVFLSVGASEPINYALRGAVQQLNGFDGYEQVRERFHSSALVPYEYGGKLYGLPETQTFPMLFYREDVLQELGLEVPETWSDVMKMLKTLSNNNMMFGIPAASTANPSILDLTVYWTFILQNGGQIYDDGRTRILLDEEVSLAAFERWTDLYTNYGLEYTYDFATRFRLGEIPIGIADYSMYNTLSVFAPEIAGLWSFTQVPGTEQPDGSINRAVAGGGTASVMMSGIDDPEAAWEFLKWWSSSETQVAYGRELESVMGTAARYAVANQQALEQMPWTSQNLRQLQAQWQSVQGVPEVPGSYLVNREINFAFRAVVVSGDEAREALLDHLDNINREITKKRKEFHLD